VLVKRIHRVGALAVVLAALASALLGMEGRTGASILVGGVLALANLRAMSWSVQGFVNVAAQGGRLQGRLVAFSLLRLLLLFAVLLLLVKAGLVNLLAVLVGFTVVFFVVLMEGLREARRGSLRDSPEGGPDGA
jgi:hypothetical protein